MKLHVCLLGCLTSVLCFGQTANELLQKGLFEEEANQNIEAAVAAYEGVLKQADEQRRLAATAVYRLGECYRKLGKTNEAANAYQRILRDFSDQTVLANLSTQNLQVVGISMPVAATNPGSQTNRVLYPYPPGSEEAEIRRMQELIRNSPDLVNANPNGSGFPLHNAVLNGHLAVAGFLLNNGADIEKGDPPPLHRAASAGHRKMVELLLARGADINAVASQGNGTALHAAVAKGFRNIVEVLLAHKADPNVSTATRQMTPLTTALDARQLKIAELLLSKGADIEAPTTAHNNPTTIGTALHYATGREQTDAVQFLVKNGAKVDAVTTNGFTALHYAAHSGNIEIAKILLSANANPNIAITNGNPAGWAPLHVAIERRHQPMVELLLQHKANPNQTIAFNINSDLTRDMSPLNIAASKSYAGVAEAVLAFGADVNTRNEEGTSPLHFAVTYNNLPLLRLLLSKGADANLTNNQGRTPLHWAIGNFDAAELLLKHKANPNVADNQGWTPLHRAVEQTARRQNPPAQAETKSYSEVAELLIEHKANVNARTPSGQTALHIASARSAGGLLSHLILNGGDMEAADKEGKTPLRRAVERLDVQMTGILLSHKANPNTCATNGTTPLHYVIDRGGHEEMLKLLLENGAQPAFKCRGEPSAFERAWRRDYGSHSFLWSYHVPKLSRAKITGATPGTYYWPAETTAKITEAINYIGISDKGDYNQLRLTRRDSATGLPAERILNLHAIKMGNVEDVSLQHDDVITVYTKPERAP